MLGLEVFPTLPEKYESDLREQAQAPTLEDEVQHSPGSSKPTKLGKMHHKTGLARAWLQRSQRRPTGHLPSPQYGLRHAKFYPLKSSVIRLA